MFPKQATVLESLFWFLLGKHAINVANILFVLNLGNEGGLNLLGQHVVPVDVVEEYMVLNVLRTCWART